MNHDLLFLTTQHHEATREDKPTTCRPIHVVSQCLQTEELLQVTTWYLLSSGFGAPIDPEGSNFARRG